MICANCKQKTNRIIMAEDGSEICTNCSNLATAGGSKIEGILTRNSNRVRTQQAHSEGDFVQPHVWDKNKRRMIINPDYVKLYPKQAKTFFKDDEMVKDGYSKLPGYSQKLKKKTQKAIAKEKSDIIFEGDTTQAIQKTLTGLKPRKK